MKGYLLELVCFKKIHMVILMQTDLAAGVVFYQKLGLNLKFHLKNKWAEFELGEVKLGLFPGNERQEWRTGIVFEIDDIKRLYEKMNDGIEFVGEPIEKIHGIMVSIKDPNGNIVDLYQPTPNKLREFIKEVKEKDMS